MSYRNVGMDVHSERFKQTYRTVTDAVQKLVGSEYGEVEVEFHSFKALWKWRRRAYEWQKIVGQPFRIEIVDGNKLILKFTDRQIDDTPLLIDGVPIQLHRDKSALLLEKEIEEGMSEEEQVRIREQAEAIAEAMDGKVKTTQDYIDIFKEGADDRRPEPGGDAADTGSSRGDD